MSAPFSPYYVGQHVYLADGVRYEVTSVTPIPTPYRRAGQTTKTEGWSLGVRRVSAYHLAPQNIPVRTKLGDKVRAAFAEALKERGTFMGNLDFNAVERRVHAAMEEAFAERTAAAAPKVNFHAHLDQCAQCREHPMELCPVGAAILTSEKP